MTAKRQITRDDILPMEDYTRERKERRRTLVEAKKNRRVDVGPVCTFYFENYETMWNQVHEMLFIERGGDAQIADELAAYNPLIPQGRELVATVMFEIENEARRRALLAKLGGVEETAFIEVAGARVKGKPEADLDRTTAEGKASSVQFIHFLFTDAQVEAFRAAGAQVTVGLDHPEYVHATRLTDAARAALAADFD